MERNGPTKRELESAVGRNWDYYVQAWSTLLRDGGGFACWNWAAFLLPAGWGIYRRQYGLAAAMLAFTAVAQYSGMRNPDLFFLPLTLLLCNLSLRMCAGVYANNWYYRSCCKKIKRAPGGTPEERERSLGEKGGPNVLGYAAGAATILWYGVRGAMAVFSLVEALG